MYSFVRNWLKFSVHRFVRRCRHRHHGHDVCLGEVVGCIVSITPLRSTVQPANFPRWHRIQHDRHHLEEIPSIDNLRILSVIFG